MAITSPFEMALKAARKALAEAYEERNAIEQRIVSLKQTIDGLSALCEPEPSEDVVQVSGSPMTFTSLTDAIRRIFSESSEPMLTPTEVRDALLVLNIDLAKYKQPLVPIHNTLKRLETQGELVPFRDDKGDLRGYQWVSPLARAVAEVGQRRIRRQYVIPPPPSFEEKKPLTPGEAKRMMENLRPKSGGKLEDYTAAGRALADLEAGKKK